MASQLDELYGESNLSTLVVGIVLGVRSQWRYVDVVGFCPIPADDSRWRGIDQVDAEEVIDVLEIHLGQERWIRASRGDSPAAALYVWCRHY